MKKNIILTIIILLGLFVVTKQAHALSQYRFVSTESMWDYFVYTGDNHLFVRDLTASFIYAVFEFIVLAIILFKKEIFKLNNLIKIFITNILTWMVFFGSSIISIWYLLLTLGLPCLSFHPLLNKNEHLLLIAELLIILIESFVFFKMFKNKFSKKRLIAGVVIANLSTILLTFWFF